MPARTASSGSSPSGEHRLLDINRDGKVTAGEYALWALAGVLLGFATVLAVVFV